MIISKMRQLDYPIPEGAGICYGIASMAATSVIRGEAEKYKLRIDAIRVTDVESIFSMSRELFSKSGIEFIDKTRAFFDGIYFYHGKKMLKNTSSDIVKIKQAQSLDEYSKLLCDDTEGYEKPKLNQHKLCLYNEDSMLSFLKEMVLINNKKPFSMIIKYSYNGDESGHAVMTGFDGKKWLSIDNSITLLGNSPTCVVKNLLREDFQNNDYWSCAVEFFDRDKSLLIPKHEIFDFEKMPNKDVVMSSVLRTAMIFDSLLFGAPENIKKITEKIIERKRYNVLLDKTYLDGDIASFCEFIKVIDSYHIPDAIKHKILSDPCRARFGAFYQLMNRELDDTFAEELSLYVNTILSTKLTEQDKVFLLCSRENKGYSALGAAIYNKYIEKVRSFLVFILSSNLSEDGKIELIFDFHKNNKWFLNIMLDKNYADVFYEYFSTIFNSNVSNKVKSTILENFKIYNRDNELKRQVFSKLNKSSVNLYVT